MPFHGANPAGFSHLSPCPAEQMNESLRPATAVADFAYFAADMLLESSGDCGELPQPGVQMRTLLWSVSAVMCPVFCSVTASGPFRRPAALGPLLRIPRPFGVSVPPKTSLRTTANNAVQTSFGPLPESRPSALGSRAHSLSSAQCDPSNNGRIQQTETLSCTRTK
jgi:hypothetical protein